jgi:transcriptional regulator with XRE-family HTH domain
MRQRFSEEIEQLGGMIRAARKARGYTQQEVADGADVSRAQLADFEKGANVSLLFLLKIARFLDISNLSLTGGVEVTTTATGIDVVHLFRLLDLLNVTIEEVRSGIVDAAFPPSERSGNLRDTPVLKAFFEKHGGDDRGLARLAAALVGETDDKPDIREPTASTGPAPRARRSRKAGA